MAHRRIAGGGKGDGPEGLTQADLDGFAAPLLPLVGDVDLARLAVADAWRRLRIEGADYNVNDPDVRAWLEAAITDHVRDALARTGGDRTGLWVVFGAGLDDPADANAAGFNLGADDEAALSFAEPPAKPPAAEPPPMAPAPRTAPVPPYRAATARVIPLWPVSVPTGRTTPPSAPVPPPANEAAPQPAPPPTPEAPPRPVPPPTPTPTPFVDEAPLRPVPEEALPAEGAPPRPTPASSVYDVPSSPPPEPSPPMDEAPLRPMPEPVPPADEAPPAPPAVSAIREPDDLPVWREPVWGKDRVYVPRRRRHRRRWRPILGWGLLAVLLLLTLALLWLALTPLSATDPTPAPPTVAPVPPDDGFERFEAPDAALEGLPQASGGATDDVPPPEPDAVPERVPQASSPPEPDDGIASDAPSIPEAPEPDAAVPPQWLVLPRPDDVPARVGPTAPATTANAPADPEGAPSVLDPPQSPPANAAAPRPRVFVHYAEGGGAGGGGDGRASRRPRGRRRFCRGQPPHGTVRGRDRQRALLLRRRPRLCRAADRGSGRGGDGVAPDRLHHLPPAAAARHARSLAAAGMNTILGRA